MNRLVILTGPSCVGKGPLVAAVNRLYPQWKSALRKVVMVNSRSPRPGEVDGVDYDFRPREEVEKFREHEEYVVMEVRGDLQALNVNALKSDCDQRNAFFEGNPFVAQTLLESPLLADIPKLGIYLSPLSREEISFLKAREQKVDVEEFVANVMRRKLLRRAAHQKRQLLSLKDLETVERRAASAYRELQMAPAFDVIIPNHDGEDSENWDAFYYPIADARRTLLAFVRLLEGGDPDIAENWENDLLP